jgi:hypothetical protein
VREKIVTGLAFAVLLAAWHFEGRVGGESREQLNPRQAGSSERADAGQLAADAELVNGFRAFVSDDAL